MPRISDGQGHELQLGSDTSMPVSSDTIETLIGEVKVSPTANTLLGRMKSLEDKVATQSTLLGLLTQTNALLEQMKGNGEAGDAAPVSIAGSLANAETATIANGESLSGAVDLDSNTLVGISMPAAWTAAVITLSVSNDGTNYASLYYDGTEFTVNEATASINITLDPTVLLPWRYIKVRSGTAGTPVNQDAERAITLLTKPI